MYRYQNIYIVLVTKINQCTTWEVLRNDLIFSFASVVFILPFPTENTVFAGFIAPQIFSLVVIVIQPFVCDVFPIIFKYLKRFRFFSIIQVVRILNDLVLCFYKCLDIIIFSIVTQNWQIRFISVFFHIDICTLQEKIISLVNGITNLLSPLKLCYAVDSCRFPKYSCIRPNLSPNRDVPTICTTKR